LPDLERNARSALITDEKAVIRPKAMMTLYRLIRRFDLVVIAPLL